MITSQLEQLLLWAVPKMTDEGAARFQLLMENAVKSVVVQAFDERELASFNVTNTIVNLRLKEPK